MIKLFFICTVLVLVAVSLQAQDTYMELYQYNYSFLNPSLAGKEEQKISMLVKTASYDNSFGNQFFTTAFLSYENYFKKLNSGIALTGFSESFGPAAITSLALSYNYHFKIADDFKFIPAFRVRRQTVSVDLDFYRSIDPDDPMIIEDGDATESNWTGDFGAAVTFKTFDFGMSGANLFHTKNKMGVLESPSQLDKFYTVFTRGSFKLNQHLSSEHSLYVPLQEDKFDRIDINNTLVINDLFIAGLSFEYNSDDLLARLNTGVKVKDYFRVVVLVYSDRSNDNRSSKFRCEIYTEFKF